MQLFTVNIILSKNEHISKHSSHHPFHSPSLPAKKKPVDYYILFKGLFSSFYSESILPFFPSEILHLFFFLLFFLFLHCIRWIMYQWFFRTNCSIVQNLANLLNKKNHWQSGHSESIFVLHIWLLNCLLIIIAVWYQWMLSFFFIAYAILKEQLDEVKIFQVRKWW